MKQFYIDEQYITDINVEKVVDYINDRANPTQDEILETLKGKRRAIIYSNKDHDEFTKLREQLSDEGYISIEWGWWNGDRVLKPFKINEWVFKKGHKFVCAAALRNSIACARAAGRKTVSFL